jgi:hypothetical protein
VPSVRLESATLEGRDGRRVRVRLAQSDVATPFRLRVPLVLRTDAGEERHTVELDRTRAEVVLEGRGRPLAVVLDPDLRLMRRLGDDEAPPVLRRAMVDPQTRTVILAGGSAEEAARQLAAKLQDHAPRFLAAGAPLPDAPVLVIGTDDVVETWLEQHPEARRPTRVAGRGTAAMWTTARAAAGPVTVISAQDAAALAALARPLPHYGRQSYVVFDGAKALDRGVWPVRAQTLTIE